MSALRKLFKKKKEKAKNDAQLVRAAGPSTPSQPAPSISTAGKADGEKNTLFSSIQQIAPSPSPASPVPVPNKLVHSSEWCSSCAYIPQELFTTVRDIVYPVKPNLAALVESATGGCRCCKVLLQYARQVADDHFPKQHESSPLSTTLEDQKRVSEFENMPIWLCQKCIGFPKVLRKTTVRDGREHFEVKMWIGQINGTPGKMASGMETMLRLSVCEPGHIAGGVTDSNHTQQAYEIASRWIRLCTTSHGPCSRRQDSAAKAPSRLIYVGTAEDPVLQLVETSGCTALEMPYVCLSHCWGLNLDQVAVPTKTTNLTERLQQIRSEELSRTFIEAIEITRQLEQSYIWIDALCICQDSLEDWRAVSATMASVYINSMFTLAASASKNSSEGLFRNRNESITTRLVLAWSDLPDRQMVLAPPKMTPCHNSGPLSTRGWCYQERKLPSRILHFTDTELFWECECVQIQESQIIDDNSFMTATGPPPPPAERRGDIMGSGSEYTLYHRWRQAFQEYSRRSLTRDTDRLVAISGLLRAFFWHQILDPFPQDVYLAGHFKCDLISSLFWVKDSFFPGRMRRTSTYVAPSWSWASVIGAVHVQDFSKDVDAPELLAAGVTLAGADALGEVTDGYVRLRGCIRRAWRAERGIQEGNVKPHRFFTRLKEHFITGSIAETQKFLAPRFGILNDEGVRCGQVYFDDPGDEVHADRELVCLRRKVERETEEDVRKDVEDKNIDPAEVERFEYPAPRRGVYVLVLRRVESRRVDTYRRVGVGAIDDPDWFDGVEKSEFTIV